MINHHLDRRADEIAQKAAEQSPDDLLKTIEVAVWLSVSVPWLEIGRTKNYGPKYIRLSERRVRYKRSDVLEWLASRTYENTAKYEHGVKGRQRGSRVIAGKTIPPEVAAEIDRRIAAAAGGDEAA